MLAPAQYLLLAVRWHYIYLSFLCHRRPLEAKLMKTLRVSCVHWHPDDDLPVLHRKIRVLKYLIHIMYKCFIYLNVLPASSQILIPTQKRISSHQWVSQLLATPGTEEKKRERMEELESKCVCLPLYPQTEDNEKEINRLSTFPFPPCMNSINRRFNTEWVYWPHITLCLDSTWSNSFLHLFYFYFILLISFFPTLTKVWLGILGQWWEW